MDKIIVLQHLHDGDSKFIGLYCDMGEVRDLVSEYSSLPGFCNSPNLIEGEDRLDQPDGFYADEYELGRNYWSDGFVTVPDPENADER